MSYSVDTYNGSKTFVIEDGTIDSSLSVRLVGKNYSGYGEVQNENFLHLLENFAGSVPPARPINGQIWFDASVRKIKFYDSTVSKWRVPGGAEVNTEPPVGQNTGDLWWDEQNRQLYGFDGTNHILIGPQAVVGAGTTELRSVTVTSSLGDVKSVILAYVDGEVTFVISKESFTLSTESQIELGGSLLFSNIRSGITLRETATSGITIGTTLTDGYIHWGTASSALGLVDNFGALLTANDFLRSNIDLANFLVKVRFSDLGYTLGDSEDLEVKIDVDGVTPIIRSQTGNTIKFKTLLDTPLTLVGPHILPGVTASSDLGSTVLEFRNVYAGNYYGNGSNLTTLNAANITTGTVSSARLSGTYNININGTASLAAQSNSVLVGAAYRSASVDTFGTGTPNSIACRDNAGNLNALYFQGIATTALFADLAEKYLADQVYDVGTVVVIGGTKEITTCSYGDKALGTVSENPAFRMNDGLVNGTYVALKGRVPVKVIGSVNKGDKLVAADYGCAKVVSSTDEKTNIFAIALESSENLDLKLVEAVIL